MFYPSLDEASKHCAVITSQGVSYVSIHQSLIDGYDRKILAKKILLNVDGKTPLVVSHDGQMRPNA